MGKELWEVTAACHGPEDPPAALLKAADMCREPLLVLIASCYEVNLVAILSQKLFNLTLYKTKSYFYCIFKKIQSLQL